MKKLFLASTLSALSFGAMSATLPTDLNWQQTGMSLNMVRLKRNVEGPIAPSCQAFHRRYVVLAQTLMRGCVPLSWMKPLDWWFATQTL